MAVDGLFILYLGYQLHGQQLPVYSQYMMNGFLINPAVAGHEGYTAINITAREQWIGLKDAPGTYAVSAQTRMLRNSFISRSASIKKRKRVMSRSGRVGYGLYAYTDMAGAFNRTGFQGTYSYHIPLPSAQLSFGVSFCGFQFRIDESKMKLLNADDQLLLDTKKSALIPDANFGVYYSDAHIYAGVSAMQLFQSRLNLGGDENGPGFQMVRHYYATAGYRFEISRDLLLEPSFLFKTTEKFIAQIDINVKTYIQGKTTGQDFPTGAEAVTASWKKLSMVKARPLLLWADCVLTGIISAMHLIIHLMQSVHEPSDPMKLWPQ